MLTNNNIPSTSATGQIEQHGQLQQIVVEEEEVQIVYEMEMKMKTLRNLASSNALQIAREHMADACSSGHQVNFSFDKRGRIQSMTAEFRCQSCISKKQIQMLERCRHAGFVVCRACCPHPECKMQH